MSQSSGRFSAMRLSCISSAASICSMRSVLRFRFSQLLQLVMIWYQLKSSSVLLGGVCRNNVQNGDGLLSYPEFSEGYTFLFPEDIMPDDDGLQPDDDPDYTLAQLLDVERDGHVSFFNVLHYFSIVCPQQMVPPRVMAFLRSEFAQLDYNGQGFVRREDFLRKYPGDLWSFSQ